MNAFSLPILLNVILQSSSDVANQFNGYLILGYVAMWFIGIVYVITLLTRQRNLQQDVQLMQQLLQEDEEPAE
jgi:hypothetical protein